MGLGIVGKPAVTFYGLRKPSFKPQDLQMLDVVK